MHQGVPGDRGALLCQDRSKYLKKMLLSPINFIFILASEEEMIKGIFEVDGVHTCCGIAQHTQKDQMKEIVIDLSESASLTAQKLCEN